VRLKNILTTSESNLIGFSVIDTGIGVDKDKQDSIFYAFKQTDGSTSRDYGGTGLGLSISIKFTHLLGGDIYLESEFGKNSIFTLYIPHKTNLNIPKANVIDKEVSKKIFLDNMEVLKQPKSKENTKNIPVHIVSAIDAVSAEKIKDEVDIFLHSQQEVNTGQRSIKKTNINLNGVTTLIVDADMRNTFSLSKLLRQYAMDVTIDTSTEECLEI